MKLVAFVPIKFNSSRLKNKNFLKLGDKLLCEYIFETLNKIKDINEIYVFCSNPEIKKYIPKNILYLERSKSLDQDQITGMDIYQEFISKVKSDVYILAHVTSPFISDKSIQLGIDAVKNNNYDSSFSVKEEKTFAWYHNMPLNYELNFIPRTQLLDSLFLETSAFYIFKDHVIKSKRRIGKKFKMIVTQFPEYVDIDTQEDYNLALNIIK